MHNRQALLTGQSSVYVRANSISELQNPIALNLYEGTVAKHPL
jgi:hypothetical protein